MKALTVSSIKYHPNSTHLKHNLSGYLGSLNGQEQGALVGLKQLLVGTDTRLAQIPHETQETMLLRYLRRCSFDVNKAAVMVRESVLYKNKIGLDKIRTMSAEEILGCPESHVNQYFPSFSHGLDKQGRIVTIYRAGLFDIDSLLENTTEERFLMYTVWRMERIRAMMGQLHCNTGYFSDSQLLIFDQTGFSITRFTSKMRNFVPRWIALLEDHYPEANGTTFVVNAPWLFSAVWAFAYPFIPKITALKISICGTDFQESLFATVMPKMLPGCLGGLRPPLDNEKPIFYTGINMKTNGTSVVSLTGPQTPQQ